MKKYEKPIVMINEELAEGVYAASGQSVDCWIIDKNGETTNFVAGDSSREFQFNAHHFSIEVGHAPDSVWVVSFSQTITEVVSCSGLYTEINGTTVKVYNKWSNANEKEEWGFALRVACASPETVTISSSYICCNL